MTNDEKEVERMKLFYSGQNWLLYKETWFGRLAPKFLHRFVPVRWLSRWVPGPNIRRGDRIATTSGMSKIL